MLRSFAFASLVALVAQHLSWPDLSVDFSDLDINLTEEEIIADLGERPDRWCPTPR